MALGVERFLCIVLVVILLNVLVILLYRRIVPKQQPEKETIKRIAKAKVEIFRWILLAIIIVSWACSIGTTAACNFVTIKSNDDDLEHFGMNAYQSGDGRCQFYSQNDDGAIRTGFAYGILNCVLSSVGMVLAILLQFVFHRRQQSSQAIWWNALRTTMYISLWCCLFTFYIHDAEICHSAHCSSGPAGMAQICNSILLVAISILMYVVPFAKYSETMQEERTSQPDAELISPSLVLPSGDVHPEGVLISAYLETRTLLPDGSIEHKVERLHSDGSKTIHINIANSNSTALDTNTTIAPSLPTIAPSLPLDGVIDNSIGVLDP